MHRVKGIEIDPFKPFDFEGFGESLAILRKSCLFHGIFLASYKQVDVLVDILDKQLIFQLIYRI